MGRQLQLATTQPDEVELLRFISSLAPIRVFQTFAPSIDELWVVDWKTRVIPTAGFASGRRRSIGLLNMHRRVARSVHLRAQASSTSPTRTLHLSWSSAGAFSTSNGTVTFTGRGISQHRMGWLTMQRRLRVLRMRCGVGFAKLAGDYLTRRLTHRIFCQMLGHDMDKLRPNQSLASITPSPFSQPISFTCLIPTLSSPLNETQRCQSGVPPFAPATALVTFLPMKNELAAEHPGKLRGQFILHRESCLR